MILSVIKCRLGDFHPSGMSILLCVCEPSVLYVARALKLPFMIHSAPEYWLNDLRASEAIKVSSEKDSSRRCCFKVVNEEMRTAAEQRTKIACRSLGDASARENEWLLIYSKRDDVRPLKGCLHVQHVINRPRWKSHIWALLLLQKYIQITVINDPIYTFGPKAAVHLMIESEYRVGLQKKGGTWLAQILYFHISTRWTSTHTCVQTRNI